MAPISGVNIELVVVNTDIVVGITRRDGDLEVAGEEVGGRDVEGVNGGVLEDECWFGGAENGPDKEDDDEDDKDEDEDAGKDSTEEFVAFAAVVVTAVSFRRHGDGGVKMEVMKIVAVVEGGVVCWLNLYIK